MKKHISKISIIIPTYNRASTIGRTIESFVAQTFKDWEMLVVDDFSTDDTRSILESFSRNDSRIRYLLNERKKGPQGARNTGILHANSDWVCLFDSDDVAYPQFLSKMIGAVEDGIGCVACYLNLIYIESGKSMIAEWADDGYVEKKIMSGKLYINFVNSIFRKSKLLDIGLLDEECPNFQEYDTHMRLSRISQYKAVRDVLLDYHLGVPDSISVATHKNPIGRIHVLCKLAKHWRTTDYRSFIKAARLLYFDANTDWKKRIINVAPEILPIIPIAYIKRKLIKK